MKTNSVSKTIATSEAANGQYLTFKLDDQKYGIVISNVQEIKGWTTITPIPNSPYFILGVLNLRGSIVPIIDLRRRLNLDPIEVDKFTVIIVVNINDYLVGLVVDAVSDVIDIDEENYCESPKFKQNMDEQFIDTLAQVEGKLIILVNVEKLISPETLAETSSTPPENA